MLLKKIVTSAFAALSLALSGGCATQEDTASAEIMPEGARPGPAMWKVSDEDTTIYLFGTVHALPQNTHWFDNRIARAFAASDELVFEIDMSDQARTAEIINSRGMLPTGQSLRALMNDQDRSEYEAALSALTLPAPALDQMEPWLAAMTLSLLPLMQQGYDPQSGVEMALTARAEGKKMGALETIDDQIELFDTLSMPAQLAYLDETVEAVPDMAASLDAMVAEWIEGDAAQLGEMMNAEMDNEELYQRLLTNRNANWAGWIDQRMAAPGNVFIAVGAGHLAGKGSLQDQLRTRGYTVTRIWE